MGSTRFRRESLKTKNTFSSSSFSSSSDQNNNYDDAINELNISHPFEGFDLICDLLFDMILINIINFIIFIIFSSFFFI